MPGDEISMQDWVEAIQDIATLEKALRETSNAQKQQILLQARKVAVERALAMRFLTGATTDRLEQILEQEPWATSFYEYLSEETDDALGQTDTRREKHGRASPETGELSSWYSGASPFRSRD